MNNTDNKAVETLKAKVQELCKNEDFLKELFECEEPEDARDFFKKNGIELTLEEVKVLAVLLNLRAQDKITDEDLAKLEKGEIPEVMMADVNGGVSEVAQSFIDWGVAIAGGAAMGAASGAIFGGVGAGPGAICGAIGGFCKGMVCSIVNLKW